MFLFLISRSQVNDNGLVAHYKFDNNIADNTSNKNDGTIIGKVVTAPDRFGNTCGAVHFDGASGFITVPNSVSLQSATSSFTVAVWFRIDNATFGRMNAIILSKGGQDAQLRVSLTQNFATGVSNISLTGRIGGVDKNYQDHLLKNEKWHHLAVTHQDNWCYAYLDGRVIWQMMSKEPVKSNAASVEIGRDTTMKPSYFTGCLDDLRIYNRALSPAEINQLYNESSGSNAEDIFSMKMPRDIKVNTEKGKCSAVVNFAKPRVEISCGNYELKQLQGLPAGSAFSAGNHLMVFEAAAYDRKLVDSFRVTINDIEPPSITCPATVMAKAAYGANSTVVLYPEVTYGDNCPGSSVRLTSGKKSGELFPVGTTNVHYAVTDAAGNSAECSFTVIVEKGAEPIVEKTAPVVQKENPVITETKTEPASSANPPVTQPVKNTPTVEKSDNIEKPKVTFANTQYFKNDKGKCGGKAEYKLPFADANPKPRVVQTSGLASGAYFPFGNTTNVFEATYPAGNKEVYTFNVFMRDAEPPVFACLRDTTIVLPSGRRGTIFNYTDPIAKDNCKVDTVYLTEGSKTGCFLPVGQHRFTFTAKDASENTQTCSFIVTVESGPEFETAQAPTFISEYLNIGSDSIAYEHKAEVKNCMVTVYMFDDGEEDNDTVSIVYNNQLLVDREMIRIKENGMIKRFITLTSGAENYIAAKAWNTGRYGLNTLKIEVYEGYIENDKRDLKGRKPIITKVLHSRPGTAGGIILKCAW
ncbi:MAG: HYR domain-containing protein [Chitinophagales bacterium]|nr:HYR domain-containing protein [Chitinophagales bacterium]